MQAFEDSMNTLLVGIYRDLDLLEERMLNASRFNLSISEIHMLEAVQNTAGENGATISELSEYMSIRLPSVTATINKLEAKGCVLRQKNSADGRVVQVKLTQKGRRAERAHRFFHRSMVREIAQELTAGEKDALMKGVTKLEQFLQKNILKYDKQ